jgi:serine acetyltransferase
VPASRPVVVEHRSRYRHPGMSDLADLRADLTANRRSSKGRAVMAAFRATRAARAPGRPVLLGKLATAAYRLVVDWVMGIDLPPDVEVGPGLAIFHGTGLVVHSSTVIGSDVLLRHGITLGALGDEDESAGPRIGDRVSIGAGAIVLGPITVDDDAVIGAGAVVVDDVPPGGVVVGNPARLVRVREDRA